MSNELKTVLAWILRDYQGVNLDIRHLDRTSFPYYLQNGICYGIRKCPHIPHDWHKSSIVDEFETIFVHVHGVDTLYLCPTPYNCYLNHVPIWETAIKPRIEYLTKLLKDHVSAQQVEIPFGE